MSPLHIVEWTLRRDEATVQCLRTRLPGGVLELSVVFCGLAVSSWMTTDPSDADRWIGAARQSWHAAGWTRAEEAHAASL